ncbi:MAG: hypothetical protein AAF943_06290 [Pseudomonadota bacterium]
MPHGIDDLDYIAKTHGYRVVYKAPEDALFDDWSGMIATAKERGWIHCASIIPLDRAVIQYVGKKEDIAVDIVPMPVLGTTFAARLSYTATKRFQKHVSNLELARQRAGGSRRQQKVPIGGPCGESHPAFDPWNSW